MAFMGHEIHPRDGEISDDPCVACENLVWGEGHTPKTVRVVFHAVQNCPGSPAPPNDLPFTCEQDPDHPCEYNAYFSFGGNDWWAWLILVTGQIYLYRIINGGHLYFSGSTQPCLAGPAINTADCVASYGHSGSAFVLDLPVDYVLTLALDYNLQPDARVLYDAFDSATPGAKIVRLTGRDCSGSCLIKFTPP